MTQTIKRTILVAAALWAGTASAEGAAQAASEKGLRDYLAEYATELSKELDVGPFKLAAGPTSEGDVGTSFTGSGTWVFSPLVPLTEAELFQKNNFISQGELVFSVDAGWTSEADATNNASISLQPSYELFWRQAQMTQAEGEAAFAKMEALLKDDAALAACLAGGFEGEGGVIDPKKCVFEKSIKPKSRAYARFFGDLRYRYGSIEQGGAVVRVNQAIVGGGVAVAAFTGMKRFTQTPILRVGYYTVQDTDSNAAAVPDEIKADYVKVGLSTKIGFGPKVPDAKAGKDYLVKLYLDIDGGVPTEGPDKDWEALYKAQLVYRTEGEFKPAITFREGKEQGLDYDKELIFGILMELL